MRIIIASDTDIVLLFPQLHNLIRRGSVALDPEVLVLELLDGNGLEDVGEPAGGSSQSVRYHRGPLL